MGAEEAQTPSRSAAGASDAEAPGLEEARSWLGFKVDEIGGSTVGRVEGVFVDSADGAPSWLVIRVGRFGRRSAVPFDLAAAGVGHVWVPYPKQTIRESPDVDPAAGLDRDLEVALCDHYGLPPTAARRAAVEGREEEAFTSVPGPDAD